MTTQIIGFEAKNKLGVLKAFEMAFNPEQQRITAIRGASGEGKSTFTQVLMATLFGKKILKDENLHGILDVETQLTDGENKIFVGFKPDKDGESFSSYLFIKDQNGKKKTNPLIDGEKMTPAKLNSLLSTELNWNYSGLTSKDATTHRKTLELLFASHLSQVGVIFDKKSPKYEGSILDQLDKAREERQYAQMKRAEVGGIAEHLKDQHGIDVENRDTWPKHISLDTFENQKAEVNKKLGNLTAAKSSELQAIKIKAGELEKQAMVFNDTVSEHNRSVSDQEKDLSDLKITLANLNASEFYDKIVASITISDRKFLIEFDTNGNISKYAGTDDKAKLIVANKFKLLSEYKEINARPISDQVYIDQLAEIEKEKIQAESRNKLVKAVDSFLDWKEKNGIVEKLRKEYISLLQNIETGVDGMRIEPIDDSIFLTYNGFHDPAYFRNEKLEYRKIASYSGTQLPMIVLQLQAALLKNRPKALRYVFIDDVPIDKKTYSYLEKVCEDLNIWVFVNINGDFEVADLKDGEVLLEGGQVLACNGKSAEKVVINDDPF